MGFGINIYQLIFMKKSTVILFFLLACTTPFAQYRTIQDMLNTFNPLQMVHLTGSSFLKYHNYQLVKHEDFLDKLMIYQHTSKKLAEDIAKRLTNKDWPAWIKDGISPEEEAVFCSMVGVYVPNVYTYNANALIAFVPELNFMLPEAYKFKNPFYFFLPSDYYFDKFDPRYSDSTTINQTNIDRWNQELLKKYAYKLPYVFDGKKDFFNSYGRLSQFQDGTYFMASDLNLMDAVHLTKNTSINPQWIEYFSKDKNLPAGLTSLNAEEYKQLKAYELYSEMAGYSYDRTKDRFSIIKNTYYYIPEADNKHMFDKIGFVSNRGVLGKIQGYYNTTHEYVKYDKMDTTKFIKFKDNYTEYLLPPSKEGKMAAILRDYVNGFNNIGKGGGATGETNEVFYREVYWYDQLSDYGPESVMRKKVDGKLTYNSIMTPMGAKAWTYEHCKKYSDQLYYFLTRNDFFRGMKGFSSLRKPKIKYDFEKTLTGQEANAGKFVTQYNLVHSDNYESQYEYDKALASRYVNNLAIRVVIREEPKYPNKYFVMLLIFEK